MDPSGLPTSRGCLPFTKALALIPFQGAGHKAVAAATTFVPIKYNALQGNNFLLFDNIIIIIVAAIVVIVGAPLQMKPLATSSRNPVHSDGG